VPGIDILVDGHSHTSMRAPVRIGPFNNSTYIVQAHQWGAQVGMGKLTIVDGRLRGFDWQPVIINTAQQTTFAPDPQMVAFLAPYVERGQASLNEVIGRASEAFVFAPGRPTRFQETTLGNMITDANMWYFREVLNQPLDFAFHNGGNIRAELSEGNLTRGNILTVLPFDNWLYIVSMRGSDLIELFNFIQTIPQGSGGFPQFSSEVRYTLDVPNRTISDLTIGGAPIDPNRVYRFTTNSFLLEGGDGYTVLSRATDPFNTSLLLSDVVIAFIDSQAGVITPALDGRMQVIGGVTPN